MAFHFSQEESQSSEYFRLAAYHGWPEDYCAHGLSVSALVSSNALAPSSNALVTSSFLLLVVVPGATGSDALC